MDGWWDVTAGDVRTLTPVNLRAYFDGAEPAWRHARAPEHQIPRRQVVAEAVARLSAPSGQTMVLLVGPAGMGRSTAVLQTAVDLAAQGHRVLYRTAGAGLDAAAVAALPAGPSYVLVSDDAQEIVAEIEAGVEALCQAGRRDVHWLLTARDDDWQAAFRSDGSGFEPSWDRLIDLWPARGARSTTLAVTAEDATKLVDAWADVGALAPETVIEATETANLLGASLRFRHGDDGLNAHVRVRIRHLQPEVQRAFLATVVATAVGIDGLDLAAVAGMVQVDPATLADSLSRAGLASTSGGVLRARHPSLADAAWPVAQGQAEELLLDLVRAEAGPAVMTCAPGLSARLQRREVDAERADRAAISCADAAAERSDRLVHVIARAVTYRRAGRLEESADILRSALPGAPQRPDWGSFGRNFLVELSVAAPKQAVALAVLALADVPGLDRPTTTDVKLALAHLGAVCMQVDDADLTAAHGRLLRVTSVLGPRFTPKWDQRTRSDFRRFGVYADDHEVPVCSVAEAFTWLGEGVDSPVDDLWPEERGAPAFRQLEATLGSIATH